MISAEMFTIECIHHNDLVKMILDTLEHMCYSETRS